MLELAPGTSVFGVFTSSKCPGAPVDWCRAALAGGKARAVVVNAGNANVFAVEGRARHLRRDKRRGQAGRRCPPKQVFVASTGVELARCCRTNKLVAALPNLHETLRDDAWPAAARGIMTTDTFPKAATRTAWIGEAPIRIAGIAEGSGMGAPDMATMLYFICTDAERPPARCRRY